MNRLLRIVFKTVMINYLVNIKIIMIKNINTNLTLRVWGFYLINQVGNSGSLEESKRDESYRNDPMKYVDEERRNSKEETTCMPISRQEEIKFSKGKWRPFILFALQKIENPIIETSESQRRVCGLWVVVCGLCGFNTWQCRKVNRSIQTTPFIHTHLLRQINC